MRHTITLEPSHTKMHPETKKGLPVADKASGKPIELVVAHTKWVYVGPEYSLGISVHGHEGLMRPKEWTDDQIDAAMKNLKEAATWFLPADKL